MPISPLSCSRRRHAPAAARPFVLVAVLAAGCATATPPGPHQPLRDVGSYGRPAATPLLATSSTVAGESLRWPQGPAALVTSQIVTIAEGQATGWHRHGVPTFGYLLSGRLAVEYADGRRVTLAAGDSLMESQDVAHNGVNLEAEPVRILVVFMGAQGKPLTMPSEPPSMPAGLGGGRSPDLVDLATAAPGVRVDLRYATDDNFTGRRIYGAAARARLQRPAAEALARANRRANEAGYALLVLDAYRPWSVTRMFWDEYPMHRAFLGDPAEGSRHNRGCAVDLTLFDVARGVEVAMPSAYDDFSERAAPDYDGGDAAARTARDLLRRVMEAEGFAVHPKEWWHFDFAGWQEWPVLDEPIDRPTPAPPTVPSSPPAAARTPSPPTKETPR